MQQLMLEHNNFIPGTVYEDNLILGGVFGGILNEMDLRETTSPGGTIVKFRGKFQEANAVNKNKRMYPFDVLDKNIKKMGEIIEHGGLVGELDHPTDSIIHFANSAHKITKLWWEGNTLMGEGIILNTPMGKVLKSLINDGVRVGISSRGVGNGKVNEEGILVIGESYKLITFDAVADPSTHSAFQERVVSKRNANEEVTPVPVLPNSHNNIIKNEASSIHKVTKELVLAAIGGIVHREASEIKARLS
jgi:hypothetical protein